MDAYEKNVNKAAHTAEKIFHGANRLYIGCGTIFANLFFMAFCLWGVYAAYISWQLQTNGKTTTGIVTRLEEQSSPENGCCTYVPVIEFEVDGRTYSFEGGTASNPPAYHLNEEVTVLYDPADPNTAQIDKFLERWLMPILLIPSMICTSIIVTFFMVRAWRHSTDIISP